MSKRKLAAAIERHRKKYQPGAAAPAKPRAGARARWLHGS